MGTESFWLHCPRCNGAMLPRLGGAVCEACSTAAGETPPAAKGEGAMLSPGQTDRVLALAVILTLGFVATIAAAGGVWLELNGRPAPSWLAMLAGSAVGALASLLARPGDAPRAKQPKGG